MHTGLNYRIPWKYQLPLINRRFFHGTFQISPLVPNVVYLRQIYFSLLDFLLTAHSFSAAKPTLVSTNPSSAKFTMADIMSTLVTNSKFSISTQSIFFVTYSSFRELPVSSRESAKTYTTPSLNLRQSAIIIPVLSSTHSFTTPSIKPEPSAKATPDSLTAQARSTVVKSSAQEPSRTTVSMHASPSFETSPKISFQTSSAHTTTSQTHTTMSISDLPHVSYEQPSYQTSSNSDYGAMVTSVSNVMPNPMPTQSASSSTPATRHPTVPPVVCDSDTCKNGGTCRNNSCDCKKYYLLEDCSFYVRKCNLSLL